MASPFYWIVLLIAIGGEFLVPIVLSFFYPKYHYLHDGLGKLSNPKSPVQWIYRIWQFVVGIIMIIGGVGLFYSMGAISIFLMILLILYGVGGRMIPAVLSIVDIYDVEWAPARVYSISRFIGFFALQLASLGLSGLLCWIGPAVHLSALPGALMFISSLIGILTYALSKMSHRKEFEGTVLQHKGLWENLFLLFIYLPFVIWSILSLCY